jgi:ABC-type multidrug transport system ATPase subunit
VTFGYKRATTVLSKLDYTAQRGVTVLLGPNGAGKSTMLKLAAGALIPRSGRITLDGTDSARRADRRAYRSAIGWLPQQVQVIPAFSAREQIAYAGWLKGLSKNAAWDNSAKALDKVCLGDYANTKVSRLSGGQLRRVGVAQTLVHDARVILMDEPTAGLDPAQRANFRELLADIRGDVDFIISTHQTEDLRAIADNVTLISGGRLRWDGAISDFLAMGSTGVEDALVAEVAYRSLLG